MKASKFFLLASVVVLASCGGSGSQMAGIDGGGAPGPVVTTIVSQGTITGFGSVIVNGVRFDTSAAAITVDGNPGIESDLKVGQVVTVRGTLDDSTLTGFADTLDFSDAVEGPITAIDEAAGTIRVLGQLVLIDASTSFSRDIDIVSLNLGNIVEIAGFFLGDGSVSATRIERKPLGGEFEVTGIVQILSATTFRINDLVVDFSSAMLSDFPGGAVEDGQLVEAKGTTLGGSGELLATRVEFKGNNLRGDDGDRFEVEGFINRFVSAADFDVEGLSIVTNARTVYENGTSADLAPNRKVEIEGNINASGILIASKVEIKQAGFIRIESLVEDVQADRITILGIPVSVNVSTRIEDKSSAEIEMFSLADIRVGDYIELRGFESSSGIVAIRVEREDFDGEVALRGFAGSVNTPNFEVLGVTILTTGATVFRDLNDTQIAASDFFAQAQSQLVDAKGVPSNGMIVADEVEIEN